MITKIKTRLDLYLESDSGFGTIVDSLIDSFFLFSLSHSCILHTTILFAVSGARKKNFVFHLYSEQQQKKKKKKTKTSQSTSLLVIEG